MGAIRAVDKMGADAVRYLFAVQSVRQGGAIRIPGYDHDISAACFSILLKDRKNIAKSTDVLVAINTEITPELKAEGIYREILRHCQVLRKEAGFAVSDRVTLSFITEAEAVRVVVEAYKEDIARETLSEIRDIPAPIREKTVEVDKGVVTIAIL